MAYPNTSDPTSSEASSYWFLVTAGGNRVICSTTGYSILTIAFDIIRQIQRSTTLRDWAGRVVRPLSGEVGFTNDLQRALYTIALGPGGRMTPNARNIRLENNAGIFGVATMNTLNEFVLSMGRVTSAVPLTRGVSSLPSIMVFPEVGTRVQRSQAAENPVCLVINDAAPAPATTEQTQAAVDAAPDVPVQEPPNKGPQGNKAIFDPDPTFDTAIEALPPSGTFDAEGNYQPSESEIVQLPPQQGVIVPGLPRVSPPPSSINFLAQRSSGTSAGTIIGLGLLTVVGLYLLSQESYSYQSSTTRANPTRRSRRRKNRRARRSRR